MNIFKNKLEKVDYLGILKGLFEVGNSCIIGDGLFQLFPLGFDDASKLHHRRVRLLAPLDVRQNRCLAPLRQRLLASHLSLSSHSRRGETTKHHQKDQTDFSAISLL